MNVRIFREIHDRHYHLLIISIRYADIVTGKIIALQPDAETHASIALHALFPNLLTRVAMPSRL